MYMRASPSDTISEGVDVNDEVGGEPIGDLYAFSMRTKREKLLHR